jgi:hypothetical protein
MLDVDSWKQDQIDAARAAGDCFYTPNDGLSYREWCDRRAMIAAEKAAKPADAPALERPEPAPDFAARYSRAYRRHELNTESVEPSSTAVHEAGHGVIARVLGLGCKRIVMCKEGGGKAWIEQPPAAAARLGVSEASRRMAIASWAGGLASEAHGSRPSGGDLAHIAASGDLADADMKTRTAWREEAMRLVEKHEAQIERVARALEGLRELSERDIDLLMSGG